MSLSKIKLLFGGMWIISGASKILQLIIEEVTGKTTVSNSFQAFAKMCVLPFYTDIIITYFMPAAALFIFLISLSEVISGTLILQSGNLIKLGLIMGIGMDIIYAPLAGIYTIIPNILLIVFQIWLWKKVSNSESKI